MIKKIKQPIIYILFSLIVFIYFLPKEMIYNVLEKEFAKYDIIVSDEIRDESFYLDILNANIFYKGIKIANVNQANFTSFLFYSKFNLTNIELEDTLKKIIPYEIENITLKHNIFVMNKIYIKGDGKFGDFEGYINLFEKVIKIELKASSEINNLDLKQYFKYENERYLYEYRF